MQSLKATIAAYRRGRAPLTDLQGSVWAAAEQIVDVDEADHRAFLQDVESRLELIAYTIDRELIFDESMVVVSDLDAWVSAYLRVDPETA